MEAFDIFQDIATRTNGNVYIGVVGPVRTGKSTFVKKFMDLLVLPNIEDEAERQRTVDELPQSGAGRTVMTTEPKFVPDEGVAITVGDNLTLRVRLVDSVGFPVPGAVGYTEDDAPRMVRTPWFDYDIPFDEAAEIGTRKIITDHSTLGIVVTTDGSFGELGRDAYVEAERQTVEEIQNLGKPFLVLLNSARPDAPETQALAEQLSAEYGATVLPANIQHLTRAGLHRILEQALFEFPVKEVDVHLPQWVEELPSDHWLRRSLDHAVATALQSIRRVRDVKPALESLKASEHVADAGVERADLGTGVVDAFLDTRDEVYVQVLNEIAGFDTTRADVMIRMMRQMAEAKQEYERLRDALADVRERGYGVVVPSLQDMTFEEPEMVRKGNQFGVRLKASAPSLHILRADVSAEYTPILGTERQSADLVRYLTEKFEDDPRKIWESEIFGKSLHELLRETITGKLDRMPENTQKKLQETIARIVNEGSGGLICIIL
ncbi:MAG: stage IV sporulation protein A [Clostridia bacterium]|nr:stage IV sporulation protein A [Clostridia bacterium]